MAVLKKPNTKTKTKAETDGSEFDVASIQDGEHWVPIEQLVLDEEYQMRLDLPSVDEYAELLTESKEDHWPFDTKVKVARIGKQLFVIGGFTRTGAAKKAGRKVVLCDVQKMTKLSAFKEALGENHAHGYRRTNRDKQHAVIIARSKWPDMSPPKLAALCNVSATYVRMIDRKLKQQDEADDVADSIADDMGEPAELTQGDPCDNCGCTEWEERDDGTFCGACRDPKDTLPVVVEESMPNGSSSDPEVAGPAVAPNGPPPMTASQEAVNMNREMATKGLTELGRLIRTCQDLGIDGELGDALNEINGRLLKVRKDGV